MQELQEEFRGADVIPAIVVYAARWRADGCRRHGDRRRRRRPSRPIDGVIDDGVSPGRRLRGRRGGRAVRADRRDGGDQGRRRGDARPHRRHGRSMGSRHAVTGPAGFTDRPRRRLRRHRRDPARRRPARRLHHPDHRLPLAAAAGDRARHQPVRALRGGARRRLAGQGRHPAAERADPGHPVHPRDRRGDRLLAALHLALSARRCTCTSASGTPPGPPCEARGSRSWPPAAP